MRAPGDTFQRYTIEALIGAGGMGSVYRAHDTRLGRRVALKVITERSASPEAKARLLREARAAAALDHPNAVSIYDVGESDDEPYIAMELVEGKTLRRTIGDTSTSPKKRLAQLADVARALASAHRRGLVHRDIKPENVMVRDDGVVKVLDFGIARRAHGLIDPTGSTQSPALPTLTVDGAKLGTPVYMAPEQIRGAPLDGRADQFSWGVLAYEALTGRLPWRGAGDLFAVMAAILTDEPDAATLREAGASPEAEKIILRAMSKRPDDRFASMDELADALALALDPSSDPSPDRKRASHQPASGPVGASEPARGLAAPDASPTREQEFSTDEVRQVLARAVEQHAAKRPSVKLTFDDLLEVANEVGVDEGSLREAARALRSSREPPAPGAQATALAKAPAGAALSPEDIGKRDAWLRQHRRGVRRHAGVYAIVNAALLILGLILIAWVPFWIWLLPPLAWGVGLGIHALVALGFSEDDWREHHDRMQWWLEERRRKHERALSRGGKSARREAAGGASELATDPRAPIAAGQRFGASPARAPSSDANAAPLRSTSRDLAEQEAAELEADEASRAERPRAHRR